MLGRCACQVDLNVLCYVLFSECISSALSLPLSSSSSFYSLVLFSGENCHDSLALSSPTLPSCLRHSNIRRLMYLCFLPTLHSFFVCMYPFADRMQPRPPHSKNGFLVVFHPELGHIAFTKSFRTSRTVVPVLNQSSQLQMRQKPPSHLMPSSFSLLHH